MIGIVVLLALLVPPAGDFDNAVTQAQVCASGYAHEHRSVPRTLRNRVYIAYGLPRGQRRGYVLDHFIPLELGGANDRANLWPQTRADAARKDRDENRLHREVCGGEISLDAARAEMRRLWSMPGHAAP